MEVLHHLLGSKTGQHILAATAASRGSKQAGDPNVPAPAQSFKTGIQLTPNDQDPEAHNHKLVGLHFTPSLPLYGQFSVQEGPFLGCFQDDRPEGWGRSSVCHVGVCNEGRGSFMAIRLSNDGIWVFNTACTMPRCHTVVHFEVKMSCF